MCLSQQSISSLIYKFLRFTIIKPYQIMWLEYNKLSFKPLLNEVILWICSLSKTIFSLKRNLLWLIHLLPVISNFQTKSKGLLSKVKPVFFFIFQEVRPFKQSLPARMEAWRNLILKQFQKYTIIIDNRFHVLHWNWNYKPPSIISISLYLHMITNQFYKISVISM